MGNEMAQKNTSLIIFFLLNTLILGSCSVCVSSHFFLDDTSDLPEWFINKSSQPRSEFVIEIFEYEAYYYKPGKIKIVIKDLDGNTIVKAKGTWRWHPISLERIKDGNANPPSWIIVEINDTIEIYAQSKPGNILKIVKAPL